MDFACNLLKKSYNLLSSSSVTVCIGVNLIWLFISKKKEKQRKLLAGLHTCASTPLKNLRTVKTK